MIRKVCGPQSIKGLGILLIPWNCVKMQSGWHWHQEYQHHTLLAIFTNLLWVRCLFLVIGLTMMSKQQLKSSSTSFFRMLEVCLFSNTGKCQLQHLLLEFGLRYSMTQIQIHLLHWIQCQKKAFHQVIVLIVSINLWVMYGKRILILSPP